MGGVFNEKPQQVADSVLVSIETEAKDPVFPCPMCGSETKPHGESPRDTENKRICSSNLCREIQDPIEESEDKGPRFPCRKCGCETKIYKDGRTGNNASRICSNKGCKHVIEPT